MATTITNLDTTTLRIDVNGDVYDIPKRTAVLLNDTDNDEIFVQWKDDPDGELQELQLSWNDVVDPVFDTPQELVVGMQEYIADITAADTGGAAILSYSMTLAEFITAVNNAELIAGAQYRVTDDDFAESGITVIYYLTACEDNLWLPTAVVTDSLNSHLYSYKAIVETSYDEDAAGIVISEIVEANIKRWRLVNVNDDSNQQIGYFFARISGAADIYNVDFGANNIDNFDTGADIRRIVIEDGVNPFAYDTQIIRDGRIGKTFSTVKTTKTFAGDLGTGVDLDITDVDTWAGEIILLPDAATAINSIAVSPSIIRKDIILRGNPSFGVTIKNSGGIICVGSSDVNLFTEADSCRLMIINGSVYIDQINTF